MFCACLAVPIVCCQAAALPYADVKNTELVRYLRSGGRLAKRDGLPDAM